MVYLKNIPASDLTVLKKIGCQILYPLQCQVYPKYKNPAFYFRTQNKIFEVKTNAFHKKLKVFTLNSAITTEKKLMNAVAKISGLEKTGDLLYT